MRLAVSFVIGLTTIAINQYVQYGDVNSLAKSISHNFTKMCINSLVHNNNIGLSYGLGQIDW